VVVAMTETKATARKRKPLFRWSRILLLLAVLFFDGIFVEPTRLQVTRHEMTLPHLAPEFDGLRIAHLSDLHCGPSFINTVSIRRAVRQANAFHPDLILLTGDYVNVPGSIGNMRRLLSSLHARYGVIAVLGNHDYWTDSAAVTRALRAADITVLNNEALAVQRGSARLWIAGLDDAWEGHPDIARALQPITAGETTIMLAHEPDIANLVAREPVDLQLSGHVHGGQVRLPWLGAIVTPYLGHKYTMGKYQVGNMQLYVSRGLGVTYPGIIRLNCRPEMTCFTLRAARE